MDTIADWRNIVLMHNSSQIDLWLSTGSAATYCRCGGIFYVDFVYNLLLFPVVIKFKNWLGFGKAITISLSGPLFCGHSVDMWKRMYWRVYWESLATGNNRVSVCNKLFNVNIVMLVVSFILLLIFSSRHLYHILVFVRFDCILVNRLQVWWWWIVAMYWHEIGYTSHLIWISFL